MLKRKGKNKVSIIFYKIISFFFFFFCFHVPYALLEN
jgi:hypothetical protein